MFQAPSFIERGWKEIGQAVLHCILLCGLIALIITPFNGLNFFLNLWISTGFGLPIIFMVNVVYRLNLHKSDSVNNAVALLLGFLLGFVNLVGVIAWRFPSALETFDLGLWVNNIFFSFIISAAAFYFFYSRYRMQCLRAEVLERQAQAADRERLLVQSQLQVLQSQIEPHFLFNTLANVQGLVDIEPTKAKQMIAALTQMLRANLQRTRATSTTLGEEFEIARCYLEIQSIRMGERLTYQLDLPEILKCCVVPPMLLQPLVENAITHGFERNKQMGGVVIRAVKEDEHLCLSVRDNGMGFVSDSSGGGVGLTNIRERLQSLYGDQASLTLTALEPQGVLAEIRLPRYEQ